MHIKAMEDPIPRGQVCEKILRALPKWFGIESAILDYIKDVRSMETWVALEGSETIGFLSICKHSSATAEIHVMGILPEYHGRKIGNDLILTAEKNLRLQGFRYLTVKTLSASKPNKEYDQTRRFYLRYGFSPLEEFKTLWGESNPCLMLIKSIETDCDVGIKTNVQIVEQFWHHISMQDWDKAKFFLHTNFTALWPQSKERISSAENYININRNYPGNHKVQLLHIFPFQNKTYTTVWITADTGQNTFANSIFQMEDGKIIHLEEYWAEPYPAPEWRNRWVENY